MRYLTLTIGDQLLSVDNSWSGVETIRMNGEVVSQKFSFLGARHKFSWIEQHESVNYEVKIGLGVNGIYYDIHRNNEPVLLSNYVQEAINFSWLDIPVYIMLFVGSMAFGYTFARGFLTESYGFDKVIIPLLLCVLGGVYFYWKRKKSRHG